MSAYDLVWENEHFIIVDKKALVLSVPSRDDKNDTRKVLGRILEEDLKLPIYPVHRLDFEVSGLIIYAKNKEAHKVANSWFEKKEITKTYFAQTSAINNDYQFEVGKTYEWKSKLLRGKKRAYISPHGKESLTIALLKKIEDGIFHWELNPITGRSHQLRFELFRHGHPIIGDDLYASPLKKPGGAIVLRAFKIDFKKAPHHEKFNLPDLIEINIF